jgi:hypothetical protein
MNPFTRGVAINGTDAVVEGKASRGLTGENPFNPRGMAEDLIGTGKAKPEVFATVPARAELPVPAGVAPSGSGSSFIGDSGPQYVVRAGVATPGQIQKGVAEHYAVPGLTGFSVQSAPGVDVDELARAGRFPNGQISVTTVERLREVGVEVTPSPGRGLHATAETPMPLSNEDADRISSVFEQRQNPHQFKR